MARKPIIAGNWKMNKGTSHEAAALAQDLKTALNGHNLNTVDVVVCPPYTVLHTVRAALNDTASISLGAQDVFWKAGGAYTGQVSAPMLADAGAKYVIIGHSEARGRFGVAEPDFSVEILRFFGETDASVNQKIEATFGANLVPIVCIGETLSERDQNLTDAVIEAQVSGALAGLSAEPVSGLVLAYEPVWAIGTGKTCSSDEAERVCGLVRALVARLYDESTADAVRIQYGGSMNAANAADLLSRPNIDGGLVGGASLKAPDFATIIRAAAA